MSHVRRKRPQRPGKLVRKKQDKRAWWSFALLLIFFVSILAGILMAVMMVQ